MTPSDAEPQQQKQDEGKVFDQTTAKGQPNGLFQASMKSIRGAHFQANRIRGFLTLTGLFTDKRIYRDVIAIFYLLTEEMEAKLDFFSKKGDPIAEKIRALGYRFTEGYEQDLEYLYGTNDWKEQARQALQKNAAAVEYLEKLQQVKSGQEVAGAAFVLMGALIIGGGAVAMPRVKSAYGEEATHLYQPVVGRGREQRKREFIQCWDSLAEPTSSGEEFDKMVQASQEFMQGNNDVLSALARNPWWLPYATAAVVGVLSTAAYFVRRRLYMK